MMNLRTLALAAGVAFFATGASAATCTFNESRIELDPTTANTSCGPQQPSYAGDIVDRTFFGETYRLSSKSDETKGDGAVQITDGLDDENTLDTTWGIGNFGNFVSVLIGIKQANGYALFELAAASGTWGVFNAGTNDRTNDISHWDVWYRDQTTTPIPLPAAGFLMLGALGVLGVAARRRKA